MKIKLSIILVLCTLLFSACGNSSENVQVQDNPEGNISISGAFALYPMMTTWVEEFQKEYPGIQFDISAGGAGKGMTDTLSGAVDIGMVSRAIKEEEEAKGAFWLPVTRDAVFPVINNQNPVIDQVRKKGISLDVFRKIFITGEITTWGEVIGDPDITDEIHVYTRSDACGAAEEWAKFIGGFQEDLLGIGVNADPGLLDAVLNDSLGIGYNNLGYAFDLASGMIVEGAFVVPIDINGNGVADSDEIIKDQAAAISSISSGKYPSPPARDLNLVTNGKPSGIVQLFLKWILKDGQNFVSTAGYVKLPDTKLLSAYEKIQ